MAAALQQPVRRLSMNEFLVTAQGIAAAGQAQHDLLRARGMGPQTVEDLNGLLTEYERRCMGPMRDGGRTPERVPSCGRWGGS